MVSIQFSVNQRKMKMKRAFALLVVLVCFCFAGINRNIDFSDLKIEVSTPIEALDGNTYIKISYDNINNIIEPGMPSLPVIYKQYIMSAEENPKSVDVKYNYTKNVILDYKVMPSQGDIPTSIATNVDRSEFHVPNSDVYNSNIIYPENAAEIISDGWMGGNHIVTLAFYPIQYIPLENRLKINNNFDIDLITENGYSNHLRINHRNQKMQKIFEKALKSLVDNPEDVTTYQKTPDSMFGKTSVSSTLPFYEYVVVTGEDYESSFDDFIEWKKRKGLDIGLVTIEDIYSDYAGDLQSEIFDNAGKLRQYLSDACVSGTMYALLAGDEDVLPYRQGGWLYGKDWDWEYPDPLVPIPILTDLYFSEFDADWKYDSNDMYGEISVPQEIDQYADMWVGRVLAHSNIEFENWISKVLIYEQDPGRGDPSYLTNAYVTQADQMQDYGCGDRVEDSLDVISFTTTLLSEIPGPGYLDPTAPLSTDVMDDLLTPYGFTSLIGHGSPHQITVRSRVWNCAGLDDEDKEWDQVTTFDDMVDESGKPGSGFENYSNYGFPGFHFSISCDNCEFITDMCGCARNFPEMYMNYSLAGGIAYMGCTRNGYVTTSQEIFDKFLDQMNDESQSIGEMFAVARPATVHKYLWLSHNLFGCPETKVWTSIPDEFTNVSITDNTTYITVNAGETGCNICVSAEDPNDYWLSVSDVQSYSFSETERPLYVVITKNNKLPYITMVGLGNITSNVTLSNNFAFTFNNDITVSSTGVLNIEPGTTLKFCEDKELKIYGELNVNGTEESPVIFTSDELSAGVGYWDGVRAYSGSEIDVDNLKIYNATSGMRADYAKVTMDSCHVENNSYGVMISNCTGSNSCTVENSTIISNISYSIRFYNSNGTISGNNISDCWRGIYARGDVDISYNELSDFKYDGIWCLSYDGDINHNDISDCRYGIYFYSSSSGDMLNWWAMGKPGSSAENNVFSTPMTSCIRIGSLSTPNLGTMFDIETDVEAGWNVFCDPTSYDVISSNSSTIKAEGNWWGSTRSISGSVDYTYQAGEIIAIFGKAKALSENEILFNQAYRLERDSLYLDATELYHTIIENNAQGEDVVYIQKSMNRMRGCYRKLDAYTDLKKVFDEISTKYPDTYVSAMAKSMNASPIALKKDYTNALNNLDDAVEEFVDLNKNEAAAYSLFDKYELLEYLSESEDNLNKSALSSASANCKDRLLDEFDGTEASKLLKEMLNEQEPIQSVLPEEFELGSPYPNPFNPIITIPYDLPFEAQVNIYVFDIAGRKVQTLVNETQTAGSYFLNFNASYLASGMYFVKFASENFNAVQKVMLLK